MGESRQGRMNSGQKEGDSRARPLTCPPHFLACSHSIIFPIKHFLLFLFVSLFPHLFFLSPLIPVSCFLAPSDFMGGFSHQITSGSRCTCSHVIGGAGEYEYDARLHISRMYMSVRDIWLQNTFSIYTGLLCKFTRICFFHMKVFFFVHF